MNFTPSGYSGPSISFGNPSYRDTPPPQVTYDRNGFRTNSEVNPKTGIIIVLIFIMFILFAVIVSTVRSCINDRGESCVDLLIGSTVFSMIVVGFYYGIRYFKNVV